MSTQRISIVTFDSRSIVDAAFHSELKAEQFIAAEASWSPVRSASIQRLIREGVSADRMPQHWHWDWGKKTRYLDLLAYCGYGIECEGVWQGLMLTSTTSHLARVSPDEKKPIVYIDFVETAPWNVVPLAQQPKFTGVGSQLFEAAVRQSMDEGFNGRVGLHSLRDSEDWYGKRGMTRLGVDSQYQNLPYFELTATAAQHFLSGRKSHEKQS